MRNIAQKADKLQPDEAEAVVKTEAAKAGTGPKQYPRDTLVEATEFNDTMYADIDLETETVCVSKMIVNKDEGDHPPGFHNVGEDWKSYTKWRPEKQRQAWYLSCATVDGTMNDKGTALKRGRANIKRVHFMMLDDIGGADQSKASNVPPVEPTAKLVSSEDANGVDNMQWFWAIKPTDDLPRFEAFVDWCTENGYGDPGATGAYRIARLPGSCNLKEGRDNYKSVVTDWHPERVWTLDALALAFGCTDLDQRTAVKRQGKKGVRASTGIALTSPLQNIDPMFDWLLANGHVVSDDGGDFAIVRCPWANEHTDGAETASYSPLNRGPGFEFNRSWSCFHDHCRGRNTDDFLAWAAEQGGPEVKKYDPLPVIQHNHVLVERGPQVVDLRERRAGREALRDLTEFSTANYRMVSVPWRKKPVLLKTAFLEDFQTVIAKGLTYKPTPTDTPLITAPDGALLVNMYMPPQWKETNRIPDVLIEHLDYLLPDKIEREYFWGWLAHKIQNPAERGVAIVMIAEDAYGIGRSWLGSLLDKVLLGEVRQTDIKQLAGGNGGGASTYNDLYANKQIVVVDETQADEVRVQFKAYENLKLVVDTSPSRCRVNPKYGKVYEVELLFNLLAFSNNVDALHIPADDRRFCVLTNPTNPRDQKYYSRLYEKLEDPRFLGEVYWYLRHYDWSAINPRKPIKTKAREKMIEVTKSPRDQVVDAMIDDDTLPDFMTRNQLVGKVSAATSKISLNAKSHDAVIANTEKHLWARMTDAPWKSHDEDKRFRPRIAGKPTHVKAWNGDAVWPSKTADWTEIINPPAAALSQLGVSALGQKRK